MIHITAPRLRQLGAFVAFLLLADLLIFLYNRTGAHGDINPNAFLPSNAFDDEDHTGVFTSAKAKKPRPRPSPPSRSPSTEFLNLADHELPSGSYYPYPRRKRGKWPTVGQGSQRACKGPRGILADDYSPNLIKAHSVSPKTPNPAPMFGAYGEVGMDDAHCFDRKGRLDPYGYSDNVLPEDGNSTTSSWDDVNWGSLQEQCLADNKGQYEEGRDQEYLAHFTLPGSGNAAKKVSSDREKRADNSGHGSKRRHKSRTAVVLRGWDSVEYTPELRQHLRASISELSLHTGGEYAVYLMVEIKDPERAIFASKKAYSDAVANSVPAEFQSLTLLFNQALLEAWYPDTNPSNGGQAMHMNQPLQLFSLFNPQFDFVWGIELDVRFTGNWYNLLSSMAAWSKTQPRKLQWEKAARFYVPSYYGDYENFTTSVRVQNPAGGVWGPVPNAKIQAPLGPSPPTSEPKDDDFQWGVGEEADDITPSAVINTAGTKIFESHLVAGFEPSSERRALMVTPVKRLSRQLLGAMHYAQLEGLDMRSELFAHTIALAHGMKIAHAPVPMFFDDPSKNSAEINEIFNVGDGLGRIWADGDNELNMRAMGDTTYWWRLGFEHYPRILYRRWYGLDQDGNPLNDKEKGRLCLPGIMIHPVKDVVGGANA